MSDEFPLYADLWAEFNEHRAKQHTDYITRPGFCEHCYVYLAELEAAAKRED